MKKSGRARAVERTHIQRTAERNRDADYNARWLARVHKCGPAPSGNSTDAWRWLTDVILTVVEEAALDFAMPPEARREQVGRLSATAARVLLSDASRFTEQISALEVALEEARSASDFPPRALGATGTFPTQ